MHIDWNVTTAVVSDPKYSKKKCIGTQKKTTEENDQHNKSMNEK